MITTKLNKVKFKAVCGLFVFFFIFPDTQTCDMHNLNGTTEHQTYTCLGAFQHFLTQSSPQSLDLPLHLV